MRRPIAFALLAVSFACARPVRADQCTPSRLILVLDKSSSMTDLLADGSATKWQAAQQAVGQIASDYEATIDLGLMIFPQPSECSPGTVLVEPGPQSGAAIGQAMAGDPPDAGNWTPMAQSIDAAAADPLLADLTRKPTLLVITDGWQWCSPYDANTRFDPVGAVTRATAAGLAVYVVGFGSSVDVLTLNKMAWASGTALANCDPNGDMLDSPGKCYYQVDDLPSLEAALAAVAVQVSAEVCDGLDNNCDGQVDEGLSRGCSTACGAGSETCQMGDWVGCTAPAPQPELCDGADNNCDGVVDEGCACTSGQTRPCGVAKGACTQGLQTCGADGQWGADCAGAGAPTAESCNGIDDDCNGVVDDPSPGLCPPDQECTGGRCMPLAQPDGGPGPNPESGGDGAARATGCGCRVGGPTSDGASALLLLTIAACLGWALRRRT